ncbi:Ribosomal RNA-processing protein 7 [Imshaugia aleurites]|uniref:Ribosomal RNA-processing protein 7 n=1 Tax=Imshaugia aleurites TaxID=172621 RepID=A0A8H3IIX4_9LECA|nr:Ribosomal RNA-processing protein 7 [Imshaugia aleurites]
MPQQIAGYSILPLSLPPVPSFPETATHYLYLQPHQPKIPSPTASRSLFLVNVPFDSTEIHIKHLLSTQIGLPAGRIEDVLFEGQRKKGSGMDEVSGPRAPQNKKSKKRKHGSNGDVIEDMESVALPSVWDRDLRTDGLTAVVLFVDRASMDAVLKAVKSSLKERRVPVWGEALEGKVPALGSARYLNHHSLTYPNKTQLLESVNNYMTAFAGKEASQARSLARQRQEADADGFVTVTRGGRTNPARQEAAQEQAEKQKEKQKGLEDFYRFQSREKRKQRAGDPNKPRPTDPDPRLDIVSSMKTVIWPRSGIPPTTQVEDLEIDPALTNFSS